ncbi:hypothetical protein [Burkholderia pyrrocinia]|uniref:hypothetical protein n=1 Tax=Burkholderia pyrrocinia TaxID=60550 RepID=UPI003D9A546C
MPIARSSMRVAYVAYANAGCTSERARATKRSTHADANGSRHDTICSTARVPASGIYLSCHDFGSSLGSILPVPGWHRWGWAGCVAFVVVAQAIVGVLVYRFWRTGSEAGTGHADVCGARFTR